MADKLVMISLFANLDNLATQYFKPKLTMSSNIMDNPILVKLSFFFNFTNLLFYCYLIE